MKALNKTIRYNLTNLRQEFFALLKDFLTDMETEKIKNALGRDTLKKLHAQENEIRNRLETDFSLVVIGDFKRGKSTLINALLGTEVVTTDISPETVTINQIHYGPELKIEVCLTDGGKIPIETECLKAERLTPLLEQLPQKVSHLNIEAPVEWLKGLCLVDTPGTGDVFKRFDSQVHAYLSQADAVLVTISALSPLSRSEQAFLQLSVIPQDFPKVFFIVNMMDMVRSDEEAERILNLIRGRIINLFPSAKLFGISAYDEFCRLQSLPRRNPQRASRLEADFQTFRDCLQQSIVLNRDLIQLNRATNQTKRMLQGIESNIGLLRKAMQSDQAHLSQAIAQCENESSELSNKVKQHKQTIENSMEELGDQACNWMNEFLMRFEKEAIDNLKDFQLTDIQRHYHFFFSDLLRKAMSMCLDTHKSAIIEIAEKATKEISEDFQRLTEVNLSSSDVVGKATFGDLLWINLDTVGFVLKFSPFKLFSFGTHLLLDQFKELKEIKQIVAYQQKLKNSLPEIRISVVQQIQSVYSKIAEEIEQEIETSYQQDIEASLSTLRQAQELSAEGEQKVVITDESLQEAQAIIGSTGSSLQALSQKLWSETGTEQLGEDVSEVFQDSPIPV